MKNGPTVICPNCKATISDAAPVESYGVPYETDYNSETELLEGTMLTVDCPNCPIEITEVWKLEFSHFSYYNTETEEEWKGEE